MPYPDALKDNPKVIFFTDFDGTITLQDSNDYLTDNLGFGEKRRKELNADCLHGRATFRDTFQEMLNSIPTPFPTCITYLCAHIRLDPHFATFYTYAHAHAIPLIVLSSGMRPIIRALLTHLLGPSAATIEIICNDVVPRPGKSLADTHGWTIAFHDASGYGHDKSLAIRPYAEHIRRLPEADRPVLLFAGDGVSDLSAARETDLLFAKRGRDLVAYCEREGVPFTEFGDWGEILEVTRGIVEGTTSVSEVVAEGAEKAREDGRQEAEAKYGRGEGMETKT